MSDLIVGLLFFGIVIIVEVVRIVRLINAAKLPKTHTRALLFYMYLASFAVLALVAISARTYIGCNRIFIPGLLGLWYAFAGSANLLLSRIKELEQSKS